MTRIAFTVEGRPKGKARHRTTRTGRTYTPATTAAAERAIAWAYRCASGRQPLMTGVVELHIEAVFAVPKSWSWRMREEALAGNVKFTGKPDRDNIEKLVMDALNGVAWVDDCQVGEGPPVVRRYGEPERIEVAVIEHKSADALKSPSERRREAKVASGMVGAKRPKRRNSEHSSASTLHDIGKRLR